MRLWVCSENGRRLVLHVASAGEVLGLSAALSGRSYEVTAEALDRVQAAEIQRRDLLHFLHGHCDVCMQVVHLISEDLHEAYDRIRAVGLPAPATRTLCKAEQAIPAAFSVLRCLPVHYWVPPFAHLNPTTIRLRVKSQPGVFRVV